MFGRIEPVHGSGERFGVPARDRILIPFDRCRHCSVFSRSLKLESLARFSGLPNAIDQGPRNAFRDRNSTSGSIRQFENTFVRDVAMTMSHDHSKLPTHRGTNGRSEEGWPSVAGLPMISIKLQNAEKRALAQLPRRLTFSAKRESELLVTSRVRQRSGKRAATAASRM